MLLYMTFVCAEMKNKTLAILALIAVVCVNSQTNANDGLVPKVFAHLMVVQFR